MGFDLNKVVDIQQLSCNLKCFICGLVLQDPLQSPDCEHYFCNQCITIWLQTNNHCPHYANEEDRLSVKSDKKKSPLRKMSFRKIIGKSPKDKDKMPTLKLSGLKALPENLIKELNELKVVCDYQRNGCNEHIELSKLENHLKECKFFDCSIQKENLQTSSDKSSDCLTKSTDPIKVEGEKKNSEKDLSMNGESKLISDKEEEVGSDDFVVIPNSNSQTNSYTKSTESLPKDFSVIKPIVVITSDEKEENLENNLEENNVNSNLEKKKKKKKKKKNANKQEGDNISLKDGSSNNSEESKTHSKESLFENEEIKKALKEAETKSENLKMINNQLLCQVKKLKDEKNDLSKEIQNKLDTTELNDLKNKVQNLEKENKNQALRIYQLVDSNESMNKLILTLREEQKYLQEKYTSTLNAVRNTLSYVRNEKQIN